MSGRTRAGNAFKISPAGVVTEIIDATADGARADLGVPGGIAADAVGSVYLTGGRSNNAFKIEFDCNGNGIPDPTDISKGTNKDCNANLAPDVCDAIGDGDFDVDGVVDLDDHAALTDCMAGPGQPSRPSSPECISACLAAFDFNGDNDVDLVDFARSQTAFGLVP